MRASLRNQNKCKPFIINIKLGDILYLVYLCSCLGLGLFFTVSMFSIINFQPHFHYSYNLIKTDILLSFLDNMNEESE